MIKFRQWIARQLVRLAYRIHKDSPEVKLFWRERYLDAVIAGKSIIRVDPKEYHNERD